jgi:hypothetical protein
MGVRAVTASVSVISVRISSSANTRISKSSEPAISSFFPSYGERKGQLYKVPRPISFFF